MAQPFELQSQIAKKAMVGYAMSKGTTGEADVIRLRQNIQDLLRRRAPRTTAARGSFAARSCRATSAARAN
ncbi:MAG: hypothetical protein JRJ58_08110 [Deltaproteobacteria bacterium]|nr:hypothetical protein [Deltaproteobacteria bacterium]